MRGTVLVVDDDASIRESLGRIIAEEGYNVVCLNNGREALDYIRTSPPPDVMLLDLMMPVMSGWQFLEEKNRDPVLSRIPVIVLSAAAEQDLFRLPGPPQVCALLKKPMSLERVLNAVEVCSDRRARA